MYRTCCKSQVQLMMMHLAQIPPQDDHEVLVTSHLVRKAQPLLALMLALLKL
jgi:hypothetical protein